MRAPIGRGGASTVYRAFDELSRREVALKWMATSADQSRARLRLEIAALRRVQRPELTPGVVRSLDDGETSTHVWLVMELVHGEPFPGRATPCGWHDVAPTVRSLLEVLDRVHGAGVVHRDLKPANVLVVARQHPVLVDFGLASLGSSLEEGITAQTEVWGTDGFVAPERRYGEGDARSDMFSVGVMIATALGWSVSRDGAPDDDLPAHVVAGLKAMTARRPRARPQSAREALAALFPESSPSTTAPAPSRTTYDEGDIAARFAGPERLLHLPSDAAALVLSLTGGDPNRVERLLERWVHARHVGVEGDRLCIERHVLDQLTAHRASPAQRQTPRAWLHRARRFAASGRLFLAEALLRDTVRAASAPPGDGGLVNEALALWLRIVSSTHDASATARFLYALARLPEKNATAKAIEQLAHAFDDASKWTDLALERAQAVPPFRSATLEQVRWTVRLFAARKSSPTTFRAEVEAAQRAHPRSQHARWRHARAAWRARLAYVENRFADAAEAQEQAATNATWLTDRVEAQLGAASAWMEAFAFDRAIEQAEAARRVAESNRIPFLEGRAEWILRTARDRAGVSMTVDFELLDAVEHLGAPGLLRVLALTEATIAYRHRDMDAFARTMQVAERGRGAGNEPLCHAATQAMAIDLGLVPRPADPLEVPRDLAARGVSRLAVEVAALTAVPETLRDAERDWLAALLTRIPAEHRGKNLGILSAEACAERLGLTPERA